MIKYNTQETPLSMREYGRNIQKLIEHCVKIENREERTKCSYAIAEVMEGLLPEVNGEKADMRKVWNHIYMMSDYKLDIDYPCEVIDKQESNPRPHSIPYSVKSDSFRCYGSNIIKMIKEVSKMEAGVEKDQTIFLVANQMKKLLVSVNTDSATDKRVFKDIKDISGGKINIDTETYKLNEYIGIAPQNEGKKKKKK